jgi:hypothetical protein
MYDMSNETSEQKRKLDVLERICSEMQEDPEAFDRGMALVAERLTDEQLMKLARPVAFKIRTQIDFKALTPEQRSELASLPKSPELSRE